MRLRARSGGFEGHVAKFMGDGVLAYFGWPRSHEDEAERAVRAGLAIVAAVARLEGGGEPLACRIGVATGLVVVGDLVGEGPAQEHAVVGDTPNLAARLQEAAAPGQVLLAEATRLLIGDQFIVEALGAASRSRGCAEPAQIFAVLGERLLESRFAARHAGEVAPIVGRDQELALLLERWRQASSGEGQLVLLTGEAGIGKSRIAEAVVEAVAAEPHDTDPPPVHALPHRFRPPPSDTAARATPPGLAPGTARRSARLDRIEAMLANAGGQQQRDGGTLLGALLGAGRHRALRRRSILTPQQRRSRTLAVLVDQLLPDWPRAGQCCGSSRTRTGSIRPLSS